MQYTTNYNLKKPEGSDPVNIQDFNDNADSLDTELKKRVAVTGGDISNTKIATADNITTEFPVPSAGDTPKAFLGKMKKFAEDFKNLKTGLLTVGMLVNNCTTNNANLPLSAAQGKVLMDLYTQLNGDLGFKINPADNFWDSNYNNIEPGVNEILLGIGSTNATNYPSECGNNTFVCFARFQGSTVQFVIGNKVAFRSKYNGENYTDWAIS